MKLSIIIVNYKTPQLVIDCITSIYTFDTNDIEIIVVDNFSNDDTELLLHKHFPDVLFIQMGYNAGFARANNAAMRIAKADAVLLLNSDTLIEEDAINKCLDQFIHSRYVACGVQLLNIDRTPQISGAFFMKGGLNYLLTLPYLGSLVKRGGSLFNVSKPHVPEAIESIEIDWINGAFLMVKKQAIDKAGLLDEDFFLYSEEIEWCSRLRRIGPLCIFGQYNVVHLQGASANDTFGSTGKGYYNLYDRKGLQIMLSNFVRIRKQFGVSWFFVQLFFFLIEIPIFFIGLLLTGGKKAYSFKQFRQYCKNVGFILRKSWIILQNKPYFYKVL